MAKNNKKFSFKDLKNERIIVPFKWQDEVLFNLYDISQKDYNEIVEKYKDKEFPVIVNDKGETEINYEDIETKKYNEKMQEYQTASLLVKMTRGEVEFSDNIEEVVEDLKDCGMAIFVELQKAISQVFRFKI